MKNRNIIRHQAGFTLIELLITVAIIAVLAIMAGAAYGSFSAKAQAGEGMALVSGPKLSWEVAYAESGGVPPTTMVQAGLVDDVVRYGGKYVGSISVNSSGIKIDYDGNFADSPLGGTGIQLIPFETANGTIVWTCEGGAAAPNGYAIAGTAAGSPLLPTHFTTTPASVAPKLCRA